MNEEWYVVRTEWGSFRLDRASYRDYLAGKLWICSKAGGKDPAAPPSEAALPSAFSKEAVRLRDLAVRNEVYDVLQQRFPKEEVPVPYRTRMGASRIDEMPLSFRASNALMRAGIYTFENLYETVRYRGLRSVRNLGAKTEKEIIRAFLGSCYRKLSPEEQMRYWQDLLDGRNG